MSNLNLFEMKKLNFFFFLSLFALTGYLVPGIAQENTAINIPGKSGSNYFQFRFSDSALGTHSVGDATVDSRTKTFTMSVWIKASTTNGDIMGHLQDNRYQNSGSFSVRLTDGKLGLYARGYYPNGGDKFATAVNTPSSVSLETGVWTFISIVSDAVNKTLTLYKDGVQIQQETVDAEGGLGLLPDACIMFVGGESDTDKVFAGDLDMVQLWNKALTPEEIKASMVSVDPSSAEGLLAYYTFVDNVDNEYQNQGSVENLPAKLVSGPKRSGSAAWEGKYYDTFSTVASTLVEGHIIPVQQFTYTYTTVNGGSVTAMVGDNVISTGEKFETGSDIVLTVSANANYELSSLLVNNEEKAGEVVGNTLTLPALSEDLTVVATFSKQSTPVVASSAIHIPEKSGNNHYMFRFDDQLLGSHTNGSTDNDQRIRTFTMSAWVKTAGTTGDILGLVQSKYYVESGSFGVRLRNGNLELFSRCVTLPSNFGDDINVKTGVALPIGEWAFITAVIDDENKTIALYKDGELVTQQNFKRDGFGMLPDKSCFFVGNMDFTGDIEDIQLWKGALTPEQIKASRAGYTQAPEDLLYYYKFNSADVDITQFPNKGTGGECVAELAYGTVKWTQDPDFGYAVEMYVYTPQVPEYVQGHVKAQHIVTYTGTSEGGSFVVKNGDAIVESGSSVDEGTWLTIEATPEENYLVKAIKVNGVTIDGQGFNLSEASEITVEFTNKLVYRYSSVEGGTVSASIGEMPLDNEGEFDRGSNVILTVSPEEHYELSSLLVNGEEKKESLESGKLTLSDVQENITVSAVFTKKKYTVTFTSTGDGQLELKNGGSTLSSGSLVEYGTELTGSLVYSEPTRLSRLTNNGESILETVVNKTFTITVEGSVELVAEFKGATYTVTYPTELTGGKLKVTQDSDGEEIPSGTELQKNTAITIVPEAELGYEIGSFTVNGVDRLTELSENGGEYWITIAEDVELTVTFTPLTGISGAKLTEVYFDRTTSILHAPEGAMWRVYNITGSAVFEGQGTQNLQNLSVGTYIAKVKTDNGIRTIKFIKK